MDGSEDPLRHWPTLSAGRVVRTIEDEDLAPAAHHLVLVNLGRPFSLEERLEGCDLVVTGEGFVDDQSFDGKVVGGVVELAAGLGVPVLVVAGEVMDEVPDGVTVVSLTERFGGERSRLDTVGCVREVVADHLRSMA